MKHMSLFDAISSSNGNVSTSVLRSVMFWAGNALNRAIGIEMSDKPVVQFDTDLLEMSGFDGEALPKPVTISDAVTLYLAVLAKLVNWSQFTEADQRGRSNKPFEYLLGSSTKTGKPYLQTIPQLFEATAQFHIEQANEHAKQQIALLKTAGRLDKDEATSMLVAITNVETAKQQADKAAKLTFCGDIKAEYRKLASLPSDDLNEIIDRQARICHIPESIVQEAAQAAVDWAFQSLKAGKYTNLDPELAAIAAKK